MMKFNELKEIYSKRLEQYVPVVARVHGESHPEFYEVQKVYNKLNEKIKSSELEDLSLEKEFKELRKITNNYDIPDDTCETYASVYNMLSELDNAFKSEAV
ncbi:MAG: iron-sulfur cluster repair di-iron protein, ric [Clostridium sp.]|nr:iron-sulfur cluster repair di-iron protein, ric [Clostridium sp.]